mgnify:CR=1 FL=1
MTLTITVFIFLILKDMCWGGTIYAGDWKSGDLHVFDTETEARSTVGNIAQSAFFHGLAYDSVNDIIYATSTSAGYLYEVDRFTGAGALIGNTGFTHPVALAFDSRNDILYGFDFHRCIQC